MQTLKKIGKTIGVFFLNVVILSIVFPIVVTIVSVVCGIISSLAILFLPIAPLSFEGKSMLVSPAHLTKNLKIGSAFVYFQFALLFVLHPHCLR